MADLSKEELHANEEQIDGALKGLESIFDKKHDDDKIAIRFDCGECCNRVSNGAKLSFNLKFAALIPEKGDELLVQTFSDGELVDKRKLKKILIPINRICSIEVEERDDKKKDHKGKDGKKD